MLDGKWTLYGKNENGESFALLACVPGCVHSDLINAGIIKELFYRDNAKKYDWIEKEDFSYVCEFNVETLQKNAYLEFDGLDTYCSVFLNDKLLGECDDMFIAYEFSVDGILKQGENRLEIRFRSPIKEVEGLPLRSGAFTRERLYTRRIQCTYGWDWVARFVTMGVYRDVRLSFRKQNEIKSFYLYTKNINPFSAQLRLEVEIRDIVTPDGKITIELLDPEGKTIFKKQRTIIKKELGECIDVPSPKLWYPNGYGEQPLYTLKLATDSSKKEHRFGIREAVILQLPDGEAEKKICAEAEKNSQTENFGSIENTSGFTLLINDIKIFCKGGNWVPCEPFPSEESDRKIKKILHTAKDAGVNIIRVWGGGVFERDVFYEECDRLGILVTQDFLMACGEYPEEDSSFIKKLQAETEYAAEKLRNRTCLVWWSGDNENAVLGNENRTDFPGYRSATYGIEPVLKRLDPGRYFLPSSPYGGDPFCSAMTGTTHNTYYLGEMFTYMMESDFKNYIKFFDSFLARFNAEQPVMGMPFVKTMRRFMTDEDIFGEDEEMHKFHSQSNPALPHNLFTYIKNMTQKIFGDFSDGMDKVQKMQAVQCEWIRQSMELFRRNKWFSSGIIYWMLNDCWPAANSWSIIDYYGEPKPGYYAFKRAAKPFIVSVTEKDERLCVYGCNDSLENAVGKGKLYVCDFEKNINIFEKDFEIKLEENSSEIVFDFDLSQIKKLLNETSVILCDAETNLGSDRAIYIHDRYKTMEQTFGKVLVTGEDDDSITVIADGFVEFAIIDRTDLEDNCFILKKGEARKIKKKK